MGVRAVANFIGKRSGHRMPGPTRSLTTRVTDLITSFNGPKVWYDPSDISTLQQDSAGTIPVTTAGNPIGRIMDKSGASNHAIQATAGSLPLWQTTYAAFDGTDDSWATSSIDFTSTDKVTIVAGVRKLSDVAVGVVAELSPDVLANAGTFYLATPASGASPNAQFISRGTANGVSTAASLASPISIVLTGVGNIGGTSSQLRANGTVVASTGTSQGTGNYGNYPLFLGRRNNLSLPFNGNLYGLIIIGRLLTASELVLCEQYMAQQTGIIL